MAALEVIHKTVNVNGINMHYVEQGTGPLVLLLHGFPEFWLSWRKQIPAIAAAGYHVVAPDLRGYGGTDKPESVDSYTAFHIVGDLVGLIDALGEKEVLLVGHDWGALHAWDFILFRPDLVKAAVILSVPFFVREPECSFYTKFHRIIGDSFYMHKFQDPTKPESDIASAGLRNVLWSMWFGGISGGAGLQMKPAGDLPDWFSTEDFQSYVENYDKNGFTGPLNHYRAINRTWELKAAWTNCGVTTPCLFIQGTGDLVSNFPDLMDFQNNDFKKFVPNLEGVVILEGGHFIHQEKPKEVNKLILDYLTKVTK